MRSCHIVPLLAMALLVTGCTSRAPTCPPGQVDCAGRCTDPLVDRAHCGAAEACVGGVACTPEQVCLGGACSSSTGPLKAQDISTADLLFVVDDSGSMGGKHLKLQEGVQALVGALRDANGRRIAAGLEPIDLHAAVTTTSVFINQPTTAICSDSCAGAGGRRFCCDPQNQQLLEVARTCTTGLGTVQCGAGNGCRTDCQGRAGEAICCSGPGAPPELATVPCADLGDPCGRIQNRYGITRAPVSCAGGRSCPGGTTCRTDCLGFEGGQACCDAGGLAPLCDIGVGSVGGLFPAGDFVRAGPNPRVVHFDKGLFCQRDAAGTGCVASLPPATVDAGIAPLVGQLTGNLAVGTCGAGQEQPLEAARRAIQKAASGSQPGVAAGEWLHVDATGQPTSKLVVLFLSDEDDCSSPEDPSTGVIFTARSCDDDTSRRVPVQEYAAFLASLGRPVAGAFIVSATSDTCQDGSCTPNLCCDTTCTGSASICRLGGLCGGQWPGLRLLELSAVFQERGDERVAGSICDPGTPGAPGYSSTLARVAGTMQQPAGLLLPAASSPGKRVVLFVADATGVPLAPCAGPVAAGLTFAEATLSGADWWFTSGDDLDRDPTGASRHVFLSPGSASCVAGPGQAYVALSIDLVPSEGCTSAGACASALGGTADGWSCLGATPSVPGACVRRKR